MKTYTTKSNRTYKTTAVFTGTIINISTINGSKLNSSWKKDVTMVTLNINNAIQSYFTEETVKVVDGDVIQTHASINEDGVRFISMRHIKKVG